MIVLTPIVLVAVQAVFAPPPAPPIKSGRFRCEITDRAGRRSTLNGRLGNWRAGSGRYGTAQLSLDGARGSGLTVTTTVTLAPLQTSFNAYDAAAKATVSGTMDIGYGRQGRIMLDRRVLDGTGSYTQYVGFCDTQFDTTETPR